VRSLIERAAAANCSALVVTVDLQVLGQRHIDIKNGLSFPPALKFGNLINMATRPRWVAGLLVCWRVDAGRSAIWMAT
jgi:L-lactate dehydrogenase (cytochrome)